MKTLQLIFLGAPGAGKGTQADKLVKEFGLKHLSTGNLLRQETASGSPLGQRVKKILDQGALVDDQTVLELLMANCDLERESCVFDGFPRNSKQAKDLDSVVLKGAPSKAFYFDIDLDILLERLINRRSCPSCGAIFNLITHPPKQEEVCDECGRKELIHREDDRTTVVKTRLETFNKEINAIIDYYRDEDRLVQLDASLGTNAIFHQLKNHLE